MRPGNATLLQFITIVFTALLATAGPQLYAAEETVLQELRNSLFEKANEALTAANTEQASLLAPTHYAEAADYYRRAESRLKEGGNIDAIRRDLDRATGLFDEATEQAKIGHTTFEMTLRARADAISAGAETYAAEEWQEAREMFAEAAVRLEKGRLERAQKEGAEAEQMFRAAELTAIKGNYLNETRNLLEQAKTAKAERYAPISYDLASKLLKEAETALNDDRYDTDRPRGLAQEAKHNALHAIYVATLEAEIRDKSLTLEEVLLNWEASLRSIADPLDLAVHFDAGQSLAVTQIREAVVALMASNERLKASLADRQIQLDTLVQETASMERLSKLVARQERQKARLAKVESMFTSSEATVLRQGDGIILRMIGLNFDVGSATLKPDQDLLLQKLQAAILEFPESSIVIEGHTDAFGSDATNLTLSQRRADAVQQYLLTNSPISPTSITALGYGESHPVANNETDEGRMRNRRIDVVIYPKW
jgi:outer membrane protein OmpA-like peptidoglycan-associated protein